MTLYAMIAIAGWMAWRRLGADPLYTVWIVALLLNAAWSWLFFGRQWMGVVFLDITALWCAIVAFMVLAWHQPPVAGLLFAPACSGSASRRPSTC